MKQLRWLLPLLILFFFWFHVYRDFEKYIIENPRLAVLHTPYGLNIHPLTFTFPKATYYYTKKTIYLDYPLHSLEWILAISPGLSMSFLFLLTAAFLYLFAKIRRLEKAYILFAIFISLYTLLYFDYLTYNRFTFLFYTNLFLTNGAFLYLLRAIYGQPTKSYVSLLIVFLAFLLAFLFYPKNVEGEIRILIIASITHFGLFIYGVFYVIRQIIRKQLRLPLSLHFLGLTALFTVLLPVLFLFGPIYVPVKLNHSYNVAYFVPAIFTMLFFIYGVRFGITQFLLPINSVFLRITYFLFFSLLYWFGIGYHIIKLPYFEEQKISYIVFSLILILVLDPIRTIFFIYFHRFFILRKLFLDRYLLQAARYVSNPRRINEFFSKLLDAIEEGLGVSWVKIFFSDDIFQNWRITENRLSFLPRDHPIWLQLQFWQKAGRAYPAFTQSAIGPIRDLLLKENAFLLLSFARFRAIVIIPQRVTREPILSEDIKFLQKVIRLSEPLMENYRYLIDSLLVRRRERELDYSARIQKKIIPVERSLPGIEFASIFQPSEKVTGDYIDFLPMTRNSYLLALGDVSGHGLGSAYLMAFIRAFFRGGALVANYTLGDIFRKLNNFLIEQYQGHDFMTLFALKIYLTVDGAELNYINAGHHPALLWLKDSEQFISLATNHRLLGVIPAQYTPNKLFLNKPFRIYLYSDGAFEVFNKNGQILGQEKLIQWIWESRHLKPREQLSHILEKVNNFSVTSSSVEKDDISLLTIEVDPTKAFL